MKQTTKRSLLFFSALIVLSGLFLIFRLGNPEVPNGANNQSSSDIPVKGQDTAQRSATSPPSGLSEFGGVLRPRTDVPRSSLLDPVSERPVKPQGFSPAIESNTNQSVALVGDALRTRGNPERFSSFVVSDNFEINRFRASPSEYAAEYARTVEPGRVFSPAQPAEGTTVLRRIGQRRHDVRQGEAVRLLVQATPNAPVTFSSQGLGQFDNLLTSITVIADATTGKAEAIFRATGGTVDLIGVLAASPVTSGQVRFTLNVKVPGLNDSIN